MHRHRFNLEGSTRSEAELLADACEPQHVGGARADAGAVHDHDQLVVVQEAAHLSVALSELQPRHDVF